MNSRDDHAEGLLRKIVMMLMLCVICRTDLCFGYESNTHVAITGKAINASRLAPEILARLGLAATTVDSEKFPFPSSLGLQDQQTIRLLIQFGSRWEDERGLLQVLRHFYDPVNDRALDLGPPVGTSLAVKSPDWALEDVGDFSGLAVQDFSYKDARQYLYQALTDPSELQRKKYFGLMFQSIGHVLHHMQDMAQPQHVRNDVHCAHPACIVADFMSSYPRFYSPSLYELYTELEDVSQPFGQIRSQLPFQGPGSSPVFPGRDSSPRAFTRPRHFWRTTSVGGDTAAGKGVAEFTNRNFYSVGTITDSVAPPRPTITDYFSPTETADIKQLLPGTSLAGMVSFWSTTVSDPLLGQSTPNRRALSEGLLDSDVARLFPSAEPGYLVFALNRFTYDAAHQFLIPRAVAYSAGMINYFFRGQLEIGPPDEGVYGAIDHTIEKAANIEGFRAIKLKVRNITSAGTSGTGQPLVEIMPPGSDGTLVAIAKFHRNNCYQPDLSGEFGSPGINWRTCRAPDESIVVSEPQPVPAGINDDAVTIAFRFSNPLPINSSDVRLQVVYRGPLGDEADAIAVATRDISEPTFIYQFSAWDQYMYQSYPSVDAGPNTFQQWCAQGFPTFDDCKRAMGLTLRLRFEPTPALIGNPQLPEFTWIPSELEPPFESIFTMTVPVGNFGRIAVLSDIDPPPPIFGIFDWIDTIHGSAIFQWKHGTFIPTRAQLDADTEAFVATEAYAPGRGIFARAADAFLLNYATAPNVPPLVAVPTPIQFP